MNEHNEATPSTLVQIASCASELSDLIERGNNLTLAECVIVQGYIQNLSDTARKIRRQAVKNLKSKPIKIKQEPMELIEYIENYKGDDYGARA